MHAHGCEGLEQRAGLEPARGARVRGAEEVHEEVRELGAGWRGVHGVHRCGVWRFWGDEQSNVDGRREQCWTPVFAAGLVREEQQGREEDEDVGGDVEGAGRAVDVAGEGPRLEERVEDDGGPETQDVCGVGRRHG